LFLTSDGNHQLFQYFKNTDRNDTSLYHGAAYMPDKVYEEFLRTVFKMNESTIAPDCGHIKVINNEGQSKFKNMAITGVVNTQCWHTVVLAAVDMFGAERQAVQ
jgi:hypothetical protein